jgi:hypothetical protein
MNSTEQIFWQSTRESMMFDGMAMCDMGQVNPIANINCVFLDLLF